MKNRLLRIAALLLVMAATPQTFAAAVRNAPDSGNRAFWEQFSYMREAVRDDDGSTDRPDYYSIAVDGAFFEAMHTPQEICIQRPDGKAEPFLLQKRTHSVLHPREEVLPGRIALAQALPDGRIAVDYELTGEAAAISGVEMELAPETVGGSLEVLLGDGRQWERALDVTPLPRLPEAEFGSVRNFPFAQPRNGRLVRMIFGALPTSLPPDFIPVTAVRVRLAHWEEKQDVPILVPCALELLSSEEFDERTDLEFYAGWAPLEKFIFASDTPNFQRRVTISGSDDRHQWSELGGGVIRRAGTDQNLSVEIPESHYQFYRVSIVNGKFPPIAAPRLQAEQVQYVLLISASAPPRLTIYYGTNAILPPSEPLPPPPPDATIGTYHLTEPALNPLRRSSVGDVANYRFFAGSAILCGALATLLYVTRRLHRSKDFLPRD